MSPGDHEAYAAPPAYRPTSAGAITALVLAIVFLLPALVGLWWVEVLPLLVAVIAWGGISAGSRRGGGIAVAASIIALLGGLGTFLMHRTFAKVVEEALGPFAEAVVKDDRATLSKWATDGPLDPRADLWKRRMDAAKADAGAYRGEVSFGNAWLGTLWGMVVPPAGLEEVDPKGEKPVEPGEAMWIRLAFEKETLWLALVGKAESKSRGSTSVVEGFKQVGTDGRLAEPHSVEDVRVFRMKRAAAPK